MPDYPNYKVNGRAISNILEYSEYRSNTSPFNGYKYENKEMTFASFISNYHPFSYNTEINNYFSNKITSINKGCAAKGFAPVLNIKYETSNSDGGKDIVVKFKGTGNALDLGILRIEKSDGNSYEIDCPTCIIIGLIGAGGGGAGGGGWWTGKLAFGGGSAPLVALHIELPYKQSDYVNVLKIHLGSGGNGGNAWSNGSNGSDTTLDFYIDGNWSRIAKLSGGKGGTNHPINTLWADTTDLAITEAQLNLGSNLILGTQGYGRITIVNSVRQWTWGYGNYSYMPGNYYDYSRDDSYNQANEWFGKLTSGYSASNSYIYGRGEHWQYYDKYTTIAKNHNRWWTGKFSVYGDGGGIGQSSSGGTGGIGAGGGAGCAATNLFDGGIGKGGRGGSAGFKIYW